MIFEYKPSFIDNTTTPPASGDVNFYINNFLNSNAGRCVELVKVQVGTGTGIVIAHQSMATGLSTHINNFTYTYGKTICGAVGDSITLMSMGLAATCSAWGNGL